MIRRTVTNALALTSVVVVALAVCATPSPARLLDFKEIGKFGEAGAGAGQFNTPVGVAVNEGSGDVYVVDEGNDRIERFGAAGTYLAQFDGSETPAKALEGPYGIAVDNSGGTGEGRVYVTDPGQGVVDVFDATGKYLSQIAVEAPKAVAVDASGNVWVGTEYGVFDEYSEAGTPMLSRSMESGALSIALDSRGDVYLTQANNEKTVRFSPPGYEEGALEQSGNCSEAIAIDPATDNIFEYGCGIREWPPFGEGPGLWERLEESFAAGLGTSRGMAVNGRTKTLYASLRESNKVIAFEGAILPDVTTGSASRVTSSMATVSGTLNPDETKTTYFFEWGETTGYGNTTAAEENEGAVTLPVSAELSGLTSNRTYHYRIVARNENGTTVGADETFATPRVPPVVEAPPSASGATRSSVILHAKVKPSAKETTYRFVYVEDAAYEPVATDPYAAGGLTPLGDLGAGGNGQEVEALATGLKPATTYHYTVVADSEDANVSGADGTFTTAPGTPPGASTGEASGVEQNAATVSGVVNTNGLPSTYGFEIGTSTNYGPPTGLGTVGAGLSEAVVTLRLSGLQPGTTYRYRLTVSNADGVSYGIDRTFATSTFPSTFATPPAPLAFVEVPHVVFPGEGKAAGRAKTKGKVKHKKARRHTKRRRAKKKAKGNKKK